MKNKMFRKIIFISGSIVAYFAMMVTSLNINTACVYIAHQNEIPESAKKYQKI